MLELPVDEDALEDARDNLCFKCGSTRIVSSVIPLNPVQNLILDGYRFVCKQCRHDMLTLVDERDMMFCCEGFLNNNLTVYDEMEIVQRVKEFNERFEDKGCHARLFVDWDWYFRMEIIVDDEQPELADAVKEAENMHKLCRDDWVPFSRRRR